MIKDATYLESQIFKLEVLLVNFLERVMWVFIN